MDKPVDNLRSPSDKLSDAVEAKAGWLVEKFQSPTSYKFYCKVAYALPFGLIDRLVALAFDKGKVPGAYFNKLAQKEMEQNG